MTKRRMPFLAAGLAASLALAGAAVAAAVSHGSTASTTIKVTEREYHIALSATSAKTGSVTFVVRNTGKIAHRLSVAGAGLTKPVRRSSVDDAVEGDAEDRQRHRQRVADPAHDNERPHR